VRRRRLLLGLGVVVCLGLGVLVARRLGPADPTNQADLINPAAYDRIRLGMTAGEVEALIGPPPGPRDFCLPRRPLNYPKAEEGVSLVTLDRDGDGLTFRSWSGDGYEIAVVLDRRGVVVGRYLWEWEVVPPEEAPLLDRLHRLLPW